MSVWQNDIASSIGKMENVLIPRLMERCRLKRNAPERKKNKLVWRKCHAGYKFPSDAIVIPNDERTTDTDPRLVRCAVWDSIYILVSDLKNLPSEE